MTRCLGCWLQQDCVITLQSDGLTVKQERSCFFVTWIAWNSTSQARQEVDSRCIHWTGCFWRNLLECIILGQSDIFGCFPHGGRSGRSGCRVNIWLCQRRHIRHIPLILLLLFVCEIACPKAVTRGSSYMYAAVVNCVGYCSIAVCRTVTFRAIVHCLVHTFIIRELAALNSTLLPAQQAVSRRGPPWLVWCPIQQPSTGASYALLLICVYMSNPGMWSFYFLWYSDSDFSLTKTWTPTPCRKSDSGFRR